jgi:hypothetical protein
MKKYNVTFDVWRESFNGRDYCDGRVTMQIDAATSKTACSKAIKKYLNPGKGCNWSQSMWTKNSFAVLIG